MNLNKLIALFLFYILTTPLYATTINFDQDPLGNPISNGTLILNQFINLGVSFSGDIKVISNDDFISPSNSIVFLDPVSQLNPPIRSMQNF